MNEGADQAQFLLHAAGEFPGETAAELAHASGLQELDGTLQAFGLTHSKKIAVESDVLFDGQIFVEAEALRHVTEVILGAFGIENHVRISDAG